MNNKPIGVFDSGIGGLSVVKELITKLPHEDIIYLGDIARIPYGTKSVETIKQFTRQMVKYLLKYDVKAIIIACNTISAVAKDEVLYLVKDVPVLDVISAGANAASHIGHKVGVIATPVTINSHAYEAQLLKENPKLCVYSQACSLFVPLIEEGFINHPALELIAKQYLAPLKAKEVDTLVLGCTHYPLIRETIAKIMGDMVAIIDPAITLVTQLSSIFKQADMFNPSHNPGNYNFYVTDIPNKFQEIGETFLARKMENISLVDFLIE